jgi:hypothetical protein
MNAADRYDRINNEGGEGYNPHRHAATMPTPEGERTRDDLLRELERLDTFSARESGTFDQAKVDALRREIEAIDARAKAAFEAEWTVKTTTARRAAWNARVQAGEFGKVGGGRVDWIKVNAAEREQGWTTAALKQAIAMHKAAGNVKE